MVRERSGLRLGVVLPSFAYQADGALDVAIECERAGLHGAFVYDHLWPLGHPLQPAIAAFPLLGAVAARTKTILLGPLVARVGLVPEQQLFRQLRSVSQLSEGRLIAALGIGDRLSAGENRAYGAPYLPAADRRAALALLLRELALAGIEAWVGGSSPTTQQLARDAGVAVNVWGASAEVLAALAEQGPVTWGGHFPAEVSHAVTQLHALAEAGATWAIYAWPGALEPLLQAAAGAGVVLGT